MGALIPREGIVRLNRGPGTVSIGDVAGTFSA